jgi:hypothetical protein
VDAETGFDINGTIYPVPPLDTFDMDEAQVLYDYSGLTLEDFAEDADETPQDREERERKLKNPGLMRALMHVTYQRRHRELKRQDVERLIGSANILQAYATLSSDVQEDEGLPPEQTTDPQPSSESGSVVSSTSSGNDSSTGLAGQAGNLHRIGTTRSDTSSPESPQRTSVG